MRCIFGSQFQIGWVVVVFIMLTACASTVPIKENEGGMTGTGHERLCTSEIDTKDCKRQ